MFWREPGASSLTDSCINKGHPKQHMRSHEYLLGASVALLRFFNLSSRHKPSATYLVLTCRVGQKPCHAAEKNKAVGCFLYVTLKKWNSPWPMANLIQPNPAHPFQKLHSFAVLRPRTTNDWPNLTHTSHQPGVSPSDSKQLARVAVVHATELPPSVEALLVTGAWSVVASVEAPKFIPWTRAAAGRWELPGH